MAGLQLAPERTAVLARGLRLEYFSLGYNLIEAAAGIAFGAAAGSVALIGFGLDSVVEASSAGILVWRLRTERNLHRTAEEAEKRAIRLVGLAFFLLAAYVGGHAAYDLITQAAPEVSVPGIVIAVASLAIMPLLAWRKRVVATALESDALAADSRQTSLCTYLSAFLLVGLTANALAGWWWADPLAGLAIAAVAAREGAELWSGEHHDH